MSNGTLHLGAGLVGAKVACIFIHGRGQAPELMNEHVISRLTANDIAFVLPCAVNGSWYDARAIDPRNETTKRQLQASLDQVRALVQSLRTGIPMMIAGFSQGACLAIEYAMAFGPWNGALVALTGCRVGTEGDDVPTSKLNGMPVYLSGADADPWIPVNAFAQAAGTLGKAGARLRVDCFPGRQHEVSATEVSIVGDMLTCLANRQPLWETLR
jgi:phospholipase/carboxylesterase